MLTGNPGHLASFNYVGLFRYFLTFCTDHRRHHLAKREHVDLALKQIVRSANDTRFAIDAYCFMPDHVHLLVEAQSESSDCRDFIKRAKQFSGFYYKQAFGRRLWQRYGFERVLRNDEATLSVARYILENPIRAGLVERIEDYPFAGSLIYPVADIIAAVQLMPVSAKSG
jgi:putative transposase